MQLSHSGIISIPGSLKTWTWKLSASSTPQITDNHKFVPKVCSRRLPKSNQKSIETDIWASVCPLGVPLDPRITRMVSQVPEKACRRFKNDSLRYKGTPIAPINLSTAAGCQEDTFPVIFNPPACNEQFANCCSLFEMLAFSCRGRRQGAKPLNIEGACGRSSPHPPQSANTAFSVGGLF
jgi:hypothetical protein